MQPKTNVYGVLSINFAIIAYMFAPCAFGSLLIGVMALVFGIAGTMQKDRPIGLAISGIIWSSVSIIISTVILIFWEVIMEALKGLGG